jgi:hypothetical protein
LSILKIEVEKGRGDLYESGTTAYRLREMVLESYRDIAVGKGRDHNEFFNELEKRYSDDNI